MSDLKYGAFWDLDFSHEVINAGGSTLNCHVVDLPKLDKRFIIVKDDTNHDVLLVQSNENVTLSMASAGVGYSVSSTPVEYIGGRPPHR